MSITRRAGRVISGLRLAAAVGLAAVVLAGCGTKAVANEILVSVDRSTGVVGPGPVEVGVFDTLMGGSSEYAAKFAGTATEAEPYRGIVSTTVTRMIGDGRPPERLDLGLWIPAIAEKGYFGIALGPETGDATEVMAPFIGDYDYDQAVDGPVEPLRLAITREAVNDTWRVTIVAKP
jgi:hypothetical protein